MKFFFIALCAVLSVCATQRVEAEFYRYTDKNGNILFTDDLSKIPSDQRAQVRSYEESQTSAPATPKATTPKEKPNETKNTETEAFLKEREEIEALGKTMNQEYEQLMQEKAKLDEAREQAVTNAQINDFNQKSSDFNTRIQAYEKRYADYSAQVKEYNERAAATSAKTKEAKKED